MHAYPGGLWRGSQGTSPPLKVLDKGEDGEEGGRVLQCTLLWREKTVTQGNPVLPTIFMWW